MKNAFFVALVLSTTASVASADEIIFPDFETYQEDKKKMRVEAIIDQMKGMEPLDHNSWARCLHWAWIRREQCFADGGNAYQCEITYEIQAENCAWIHLGRPPL